MKTAFLILAHKNPHQLCKLIAKLQHEDAGIFLHLDKRSDERAFLHTFKEHGVQPDFLARKIKIIYSSRTYIDATLILIKQAFQTGFDYFVLLSGQDLPLRPVEDILSFFKAHSQMNFIDFTQIPNKSLWYDGLGRTEFFSFRFRNRMETLFPFREIQHNMSCKGRILNYLLWIRNFGKTHRKFPLSMTPFYSSQWWNITRETMDYILRFLSDNPMYYQYYKHALHPEEMFFQSIVLNSYFKQQTINDNLRYIRWKSGKKHPELIDLDELESLAVTSEKLFARKFDINK
jgi:hypothetical protein